jgi:prepilin-type N-terminal cleavage/methylation domain-containing protein
MKRLRKGFTLIELLVVVAIIGILATVIIINVGSARLKANDSKVMSDLSTTQRIAAQCIAEDGSLSSGGAAFTNGGAAVANPSGDICSDTTKASGQWPAVSGKSSNGGTWAYNNTDLERDAQSATGTFKYAAWADVSGTDYYVRCSETGCSKSW